MTQYNYNFKYTSPTQSIEELLKVAVEHHKRGDFEQAENIYREILSKYPDNADALNFVGMIESKKNNNSLAEKLISKAISINPDDARFYNNLGMVYEAQSRLLDAKKLFQDAQNMNPYAPEASLNLARVLSKIGDYKGAVEVYENIITKFPERFDSYRGLAILYRQMNRIDEIENIFKRALEVVPDYPAVHDELGLHYMITGRLDDARECFLKALEINPDMVSAYFNLAHAGKHETLDKEFVNKIHAILESEDHNDAIASTLNFALGKIYDDAKMYDEAFKYYSEANKARSRKYIDAEKSDTELIDRIIEIFDKEFIKSAQIDIPSELPVFIVGMPRSGSTLVEQIIASHPAVTSSGELSYFLTKSRIIPKQFGTHDRYPFCMRNLNAELFKSIGWEYIGVLKNEVKYNGEQRILDKNLYNYLHLGLIRILFPEARIIHIRRNPMDTCLSIFFTSFQPGENIYAYDLVEIGQYYSDYQRLMEHWRQQLTETMYEVDYEALINNQEDESRRIIDYIGLDWDDRCLEFHKTERNIRTASVWQVRRPIYKDSVQRWKNYEHHLEPLKKILKTN